MNTFYPKILVTGASGVVGRALVEELNQHYPEVYGISTADIDLTEYDQTLDYFKKIKPDWIFHLAGKVYGIMGNLNNQGSVYLENIKINTHVIEAAKQICAKKIIAMGTVAIYSDLTPLPMSEDQIWVGPPHESEAAYAHTKRSMLAQLEAYKKQYGMDYAFVISTNLFGPHDKFDEKNGHVIPSLISKFYHAIKNNQPITIWGTGAAKRDFLYSKDAALALRLIAENFSGAINLATGSEIYIKDVVEMLVSITDYKGEILWDALKPEGQHNRQYNIIKLKELGFSPQYHLKDALQETYHWFKDNADQARR